MESIENLFFRKTMCIRRYGKEIIKLLPYFSVIQRIQVTQLRFVLCNAMLRPNSTTTSVTFVK